MLKVPYVTSYLTEHFADDAFVGLEGYVERGGYATAKKAIRGLAPEELVELVKAAGLQGRGGAGFSAGLKWSFMPGETDAPKWSPASESAGRIFKVSAQPVVGERSKTYTAPVSRPLSSSRCAPTTAVSPNSETVEPKRSSGAPSLAVSFATSTQPAAVGLPASKSQ